LTTRGLETLPYASRAKERDAGENIPSTASTMPRGDYVCEVRYGDATANALQRGLWTHTKNGLKFFDSVTNGWIDYSHNVILVRLFSHALVSSEAGHATALQKIKEDIELLKQRAGLAS